MIVKEGGQLENVNDRLKEIKFSVGNEVIELWINDSSLSYLTIEDALQLKRELEKSMNDLIYRKP